MMFKIKNDTDLNRLKDFGFRNTLENCFYKKYAGEDGVDFELIVNPCGCTEYKNQLVVNVCADVAGNTCDEYSIDINVIFDDLKLMQDFGMLEKDVFA